MADNIVVPVQKTSIMRFVNIRGAQKLHPMSVGTHYIEYDVSASIASRTSNAAPALLYDTLVDIRSNDALNGAAQAKAIATALANFKLSNRFITDEATLTTLAHSSRVELGAFLRQNKHSLDKTDGASRIAGFQVPPITQANFETLKLKVWDNFLLHVIEQNNHSLCDALVGVLRALHLEQLSSSTDWWRVTHSMPALPTAIFPLKAVEQVAATNNAKTAEPQPSNADSVAFIQNELDFLLKSKQEIALWESNTAENNALARENAASVVALPNTDTDEKALKEVEKAAETPSSSPEIPKEATTMRITDATEVGDNTAKLLEILRLPKSPRVELVRQRIAAREEELTAALFQKLPLNNDVVVYAGAVWQRTTGTGTPTPPTTPIKASSMACFVRPLGIADFMRVEQELCRYVPGEVSHIENVLRGESKVRTTRNLFRSENTYSYSKETEKEEERDMQTTDRFEMEKETSSLLNEKLAVSTDVTVMGKYGEVSITANAGASYDTAKEDSHRDAVRSSKETVEHVRQRMTERIKEERITKILKEYEETNVHSLESKTANTVGVYRWLDKIYLATLKNYGKRLTFGFDIPEPAAFHLWAMTDADNGANAMVLSEPIHPNKLTRLFDFYTELHPVTHLPVHHLIDGTERFKPLVAFNDITEVNYKYWAAAYGAEVELPPAERISSFISLTKGGNGDAQAGITSKTTLTRPNGYYLDTIQMSGYYPAGGSFVILVGNQFLEMSGNTYYYSRNHSVGSGANSCLPNTGSNQIPISMFQYTGERYVIDLHLVFKRSEHQLNTWKQKTFNAIMSAYETKLAEYRNALEEAKAQSRNERRAGTNPLMNEQIVRAELKKLCMYSFVKDAFFIDDPSNRWDVPTVGHLGFWNTWLYGNGFPEYNLSCDAYDKFRKERMAFMEEVFDWELLVSEFLPYYYAQQPKWKKLYQLTDNDPMFLNFLQAGLAKVRVPVKAGKEAAALRFWQTKAQEVTRGNEPYLFADDFIKDLLADVQEPIPALQEIKAVTDGGEGTEDHNRWIVRIPTTLVMLEESSGGITEEGLLCSCSGDFLKPESLTMPYIQGRA